LRGFRVQSSILRIAIRLLLMAHVSLSISARPCIIGGSNGSL
jgi:hypothetical protein